MTPTILAAGILPEVTFAIGGASQNLIYDIGINPVSVPTGTNLTLKIILQIVSPSGYVMYENAGWNTSNFSAPDLLTGTAPLPPLTGYTTPESGVYKINIQAQYTDSTGLNPIVTNATVNYSSGNVCVSCLPSPALNIVPNCTNVLLTMTDVTNYVLSGYTFTGVSRVLQAVPPPNSGRGTRR